MRTSTRAALVAPLAALAAFSAPACLAQSSGAFSWTAGAGVTHRELVERADNGARLVTERGELARAFVTASPRAPGWDALQARLELGQGRLSYAGQTQGGAPLATTSRHQDVEFRLGWRPFAPASWGELQLDLAWQRLRRDIAGTGAVGGLVETSSLAMPGLAWRSPSLAWGGLAWQAGALWRGSVHHRIEVGYHGVFDASSLRGPQRTEAGLSVDASASNLWRVSLEWRRASQGATDAQPLLRGGVVAGTVREPALRIDDVSLRVNRAF